MDNKLHCAALCIDLSKSFDAVDHTMLKHRLFRVGLSDKLSPGLIITSQTELSVQAEGCTSSSLKVTKGVPQGSVHGQLVFFPYIHNITQNVSNAK